MSEWMNPAPPEAYAGLECRKGDVWLEPARADHPYREQVNGLWWGVRAEDLASGAFQLSAAN